LIALAIALVVVIAAVAVIVAQGPVSTGSADQGDNNSNPSNDPGTTPTTGDNNNGNGNGNDQPALPALTTITADKTACGFWEKTNTYTWSVNKEVYGNDDVLKAKDCDGYNVQIEPGESAVVSYAVSADVSGPCVTTEFGVRGDILVTNTGCSDTKDLTIWDTVQTMACDGAFTDYVTFQVDTSSHPVLAAGESYSYAYEVVFTPIEGVAYRNVANVTISNFVDHDGECFGVQACAEFSLPDCPTIINVDDAATLRDDFSVPCGFKVEALTEVGPWDLSICDSVTHWEFCVNLKVTNVDAPRNMTYVLCNQAILDPKDTAEISCHVPVTIYSGPFETTLCVKATDKVSWTEAIELNLALPDDWSVNSISTSSAQSIADVQPVMVSQALISDDGTYNVWGTIKVTNTGCNPTEGLTIKDTVQMWNGTCWVDVASICVDVSAMPVLQPGESYCYPYAVTFTLENVSLLGLGSCDLQQVVCTQICNYDDDASGFMGVEIQVPLDVPLKPCVLTMETKAAYTSDEVTPIAHSGQDSQMEFVTEVCYDQMVVIRNCADRVTVDTWTNITAHSTVTHSCWHECVSQELNTAIYHSESAVIMGNDNKAVVQFDATSYDNESMTICILDYPVELSISAVLYTNNCIGVHSAEDCFAFNNEQMMFYGVFASFEMPADLAEL
jgi:hypothetical protein